MTANNEENSKGAYYKGDIETIEYMEYIASSLTKNLVAPEKIVNIVLALKYLSARLGAKDDISVELEKAENYIHRARTGEWMK